MLIPVLFRDVPHHEQSMYVSDHSDLPFSRTRGWQAALLRNWGLCISHLCLVWGYHWMICVCVHTVYIYIYMCVWFWKEQLSSSTKNMTAVLQLGAMISSPFITNKPPRSSKTTDLLGLDQSLFLKQPIWLKSRKHIKPWENMMTKIHKSDSNLAQFWSKVAQKCSSVQKSEEKWYQEKGVWHQTWNGVWTAITMTCAHMGSLTVTVDVYVFN